MVLTNQQSLRLNETRLRLKAMLREMNNLTGKALDKARAQMPKPHYFVGFDRCAATVPNNGPMLLEKTHSLAIDNGIKPDNFADPFLY